MKNDKLSFDVGDDHVEFTLFKSFKFPSISDECHMIDVVDRLMREIISNVASNGFLEHLLLNDSTNKEESPEVAMCARYLKASPQVSPFQAKVENFQIEEKPLSDEKQFSKVELKPLPSSLRHEFLGPYSTYPVIVNASLKMYVKLTLFLEYLKSIERPQDILLRI